MVCSEVILHILDDCGINLLDEPNDYEYIDPALLFKKLRAIGSLVYI
jgi:hypothetical protein